MSNLEQQQQETTHVRVKRKYQKRHPKSEKIQQQQQINTLTTSRLRAEEAKAEEYLADIRQRNREHDRFFANAKADPAKVEELTKYLEETLHMLKLNGKPPRMWERVVHVMIAQKINSEAKAILPTEFGEAIKNVYDDINPKIKHKSLHKVSSWVRAMYGTANEHGFQIKSIDEGKIKRYFMIVRDEDREKYKERLGFRIENGFTAIDKFELQSKKVKEQQAEQRPLLVATGNKGETEISENEEQDEKEKDDELESNKEENENE